MRTSIIIPARMGSLRFPGKIMADLNGKKVIQRVFEQAQKVKNIDGIIIAVDDRRVFDACQEFGAKVCMTRTSHTSGTQRITEAACKLSSDVIVNWQGDEPLMDPGDVSRAIDALTIDPSVDIVTLATPFCRMNDFEDPNCVKVVVDQNGFALYFSRSAIPNISRKREQAPPLSQLYKHLGLYVYRKDALMKLANVSPALLEELECLEQLRALYYGLKIKVLTDANDTAGIDTPDDLDRVAQQMRVH